MANMRANPWSFTSSDQATSAAIASIVRNGQGSALITTTGAHGLTGQPLISLQGVVPILWNGIYTVQAVPSTTTLLIPIYGPQTTLANATTPGTLYTAAYGQTIDVTQMLWDGATTGSLNITDGSGNPVWVPASPAFSGTLTYMKAHPIFGLVLVAITSGTLQISV